MGEPHLVLYPGDCWVFDTVAVRCAAVTLFAGVPMGPEEVATLVGLVDEGRLRGHVEFLASGERRAQGSSAHHGEAAEYVFSQLECLGLETRRQTFDASLRQGVNVIGSLDPVPCGTGSSAGTGRRLLVSAHYDTVSGSPGADDNASGLAAMLECARVLSKARPERAVDFVAFDMEEKQPEGGALLGSTAFVRDLSKRVGRRGGKDVYEGVYNLEMVGYTSGPGTQVHPPGFRFLFPRIYDRVRRREFRGDFVTVVARGPSIRIGRIFQRTAGQWVPNLRMLLLPDIFRSDHSPFWLAGIPAIMITDTANFRNPHYHRASDTPGTLDYGFLGNVTRALAATLASHGDPA